MNCFSSFKCFLPGNFLASNFSACCRAPLEAGDFDNAHVLLLHIEQAVILELGEEAAYGFELNPR